VQLVGTLMKIAIFMEFCTYYAAKRHVCPEDSLITSAVRTSDLTCLQPVTRNCSYYKLKSFIWCLISILLRSWTLFI